ncbi:G0/G1 switch protein 2 [Liparis tanakae]|uniref:G0/G1 switch protein 2 n=1 Tax=Liparis tanakae TaxID=230148 RepID=A0A4Z2JE03_9TELE|nr:G0/G1 switch protein 2 [Liparis tanakae]
MLFCSFSSASERASSTSPKPVSNWSTSSFTPCAVSLWISFLALSSCGSASLNTDVLSGRLAARFFSSSRFFFRTAGLRGSLAFRIQSLISWIWVRLAVGVRRSSRVCSLSSSESRPGVLFRGERWKGDGVLNQGQAGLQDADTRSKIPITDRTRRSPGQVIVKVSTALTVHTSCIVLAVTLRVAVGQASVGVSMAQTAAHHLNLLQGIKPTESSAWRPWDLSQLDLHTTFIIASQPFEMENLQELIPFAKEMLSQKPSRGLLKVYLVGSVFALLGTLIGLVETVCYPFSSAEPMDTDMYLEKRTVEAEVQSELEDQEEEKELTYEKVAVTESINFYKTHKLSQRSIANRVNQAASESRREQTADSGAEEEVIKSWFELRYSTRMYFDLLSGSDYATSYSASPRFQLRAQSWQEAQAELQQGKKRQTLTRQRNQPGDQQHQQSTTPPATTPRTM